MAQALSLTTTHPLLSQKTGYSPKPDNKVIAPCLVSFPSPKKPLQRVGRVRAQASDDNKDNSVDVHVSKGDQGTAVERKPRRGAMDISPFGKFAILSLPFGFRLCLLLWLYL